jgi:hypothetical protein
MILIFRLSRRVKISRDRYTKKTNFFRPDSARLFKPWNYQRSLTIELLSGSSQHHHRDFWINKFDWFFSLARLPLNLHFCHSRVRARPSISQSISMTFQKNKTLWVLLALSSVWLDATGGAFLDVETYVCGITLKLCCSSRLKANESICARSDMPAPD